MDKRVIYAVIVSMGIVTLWTFFTEKSHPHAPPTANVSAPLNPSDAKQPSAAPEQKPAATKATDPKAADAKSAEAKPTDAKPSDAKPSDAKPSEQATTEKSDAKAPPKEQLATFEQPGHYSATFTSNGAAPIHWVLLNPQYKEDKPKESNKVAQPIDLVRTPWPSLLTPIEFPQSPAQLEANATWVEQPRGSDGDLVYTWDSGDTHVEKRFAMVPGTYETHLTLTVENRGDKAIAHKLKLQVNGWQDPSIKPGGFLSRRVSQTQGLCDLNGKVKKGDLQALQKQDGALHQQGNVRWVGIGEQFFVTAAALKQDPSEGRTCDVYARADGSISSTLTVDEKHVAPHGKQTYDVALFFGPKLLSQLDAVKAGGADAGMGTALDYGYTEAIARPMLAVLKGIHAVVPNWGVAIIILTILVKVVTWWPTQRSMQSMKAMAKLKPEMDKLKEKYGDDKNAMNAEMMTLYKKHNVNPLGGCLPVLLQMPVFFALFAMLGNSVELYRSSFVFWIRDLTAPDPYYALPLLMGGMMFAQQKMSPTPPDPQQKAMQYIMPVMFTAFSIFMPAGLTLYYFVNSILTMLQQWWMNRRDKPARPKVLAKPARA